MQDIIFLVLIFLGILSSGFYSGAETAITSVMNRLRLKQMAADGDSEAITLVHFLERKEDIISVTLIGTNVSNILVSVLATLIALGINPYWGEIYAIVLLTPVILVFGEILPKAIGRYYAIPVSIRIIPLLEMSLVIFKPFVYIFSRFSTSVISDEKSSEEFLTTKEELQTLVSEGKEHGVWDSQEHDILQNIFELGQIKVKDIMKPMAKVRKLTPKMNVDELKILAAKTGFSLFPVYDERSRVVKGLVSIYDLIFDKENITSIEGMMRPLYEVPHFKPIDDCLREMRMRRQAMAVVKDQRGRHIGIVTLEDVLEEIVGEIE